MLKRPSDYNLKHFDYIHGMEIQMGFSSKEIHVYGNYIVSKG